VLEFLVLIFSPRKKNLPLTQTQQHRWPQVPVCLPVCHPITGQIVEHTYIRSPSVLI
jgi:hypothetical protein